MVLSMIALVYLWGTLLSTNAFTIQPHRSYRHEITWSAKLDSDCSNHHDGLIEASTQNTLHDIPRAFATVFRMMAVASIISCSTAPLPAVSVDTSFGKSCRQCGGIDFCSCFVPMLLFFGAFLSPTATTTFSSIQLADSITTMDLSLPSYGEISSPKASVGNVESLTIKSLNEGVGVKARKSAASPKSKEGGGMGINIDVSKVLPSLGKGPKATATTNNDSAPRPAQKTSEKPKQKDEYEPAATIKFMDASMPSYGESAAIKDTNPFRL
jgi:hypothetical protein